MKELDDITGGVVDTAMKIHMELGPGLLEPVYEAVLARALARRGFRTDLIVDERVIVELKSVEKLASVHSKQLLTYLRLMNLPVGLLIIVGAATLKEGLHRIVNNLQLSASPYLRASASPREPITLNDSIIEATALSWFGELGYSCLAAEALTTLPRHESRHSVAIAPTILSDRPNTTLTVIQGGRI